jgi:hypothetical protein
MHLRTARWGTFRSDATRSIIIVRMTCYSASYQGTMTPDSEIAEMAWFTHSDKYKSSPVDQIIFDWLLEKQLIG